jgi:hypothetical protein
LQLLTRAPLSNAPAAKNTSPQAKARSSYFSSEDMAAARTPQCSYSFAQVRPFAAAEDSRSSANQLSMMLQPLPFPIQSKLMVGAVNDPLEHEADRVADQVMRMAEPATAGFGSAAFGHATSASTPAFGVQRKCDCGGSCGDCKKNHSHKDHVKVQMKAAAPGVTTGLEAPAIVHDVLRSPGQPLDASTRAFMEPRFAHDFSKVRIHNDAKAAESARAMGARAYTVGSNVVFGSGEYGTGTAARQRLLGHELAHVVQQGASSAGAPLLQRQPNPHADTKEDAKKAHVAQQENVAKLLAEARGWRKNFDQLTDSDKLYLNTVELLDKKKMSLVVLTPTHNSDPNSPVYFDVTMPYDKVGGDYSDNPKFPDNRTVSPSSPGTKGITDMQSSPQQPSLSTIPPKVEQDPLGTKPAAPPPQQQPKPKTPDVVSWNPAEVRLFLGQKPIFQSELRNVFVHEGQHVADLNYLKSHRLVDPGSMLELYKSEFRAHWLQPPVGIPCPDCLAVDSGFPGPDPLKKSDQQTVTVDSNRKCAACAGTPGTAAASRSEITNMKNARQLAIFSQLLAQYSANQFDCFFVCDKSFRDAVNDYDVPAGTNVRNSVRLLDFRLELQKLTPDMKRAEVESTGFLNAVKALNADDWAFLGEMKKSPKDRDKLADPLWTLINGFSPPPIHDALITLKSRKDPTKDAGKILDQALKKLK